MSTRLQIVISKDEAARLHRCAAREGLTLSEWARRALRQAEGRQTGPAPEHKIGALEEALSCGHPTADLDHILNDIERGRDLH